MSRTIGGFAVDSSKYLDNFTNLDLSSLKSLNDGSVSLLKNLQDSIKAAPGDISKQAGGMALFSAAIKNMQPESLQKLVKSLDDADPTIFAGILAKMPADDAAVIVNKLPIDDAAKKLNTLSDTEAASILGKMSEADSTKMAKSMNRKWDFPTKTLGTVVVAVGVGVTVKVLDDLAKKKKTEECIAECLPFNYGELEYGNLDKKNLKYKSVGPDKIVCTAKIDNCRTYCKDSCEKKYENALPGASLVSEAAGDAGDLFGDIWGKMTEVLGDFVWIPVALIGIIIIAVIWLIIMKFVGKK